MRVAARKPRYERHAADDRRQALIEATIASLKRHGHDGLSVRRIAAEAGVSIGLINHHFPNKNALVAESYRHFSRQLSEGFAAAVQRAAPDPRARLRAFFEAIFSRPNLDPRVLSAWIVFWGLFRQSPELRKAHDEVGRGYGELLHSLLAELMCAIGRPHFELRPAEIGLTALLDGLWLEWCLDPKNFQPAEAIVICESWSEYLSTGKPLGAP
ncbi:MAG: TetR family transcriptional regulator C-terminal domain-containing protein [Steroidobacteraceae bacterium]